MTTVQKKTVLITGCSTGGIGWALVKAFRERDFYVFATVRDISKAADLSGLSDVELLELDVTVLEAISRCKDTVAQRTGGGLDVLINNAGVEFNAPLLDVNMAEAKALYDVNVWGPLAMVQAFAPLLIEAKGVVVNQSSIDAALSMVWAGIFSSSKAALARLSETMRVELEPLGVRVVTAMSGSVNTPMFGKPGGHMKLSESSYYHGVEEVAYKERLDHQRQASNVDAHAEKLVKTVLGGSLGVVWQGAFAQITRILTWVFPTWFADRMVNAGRGVKQVKRL